MNLNRILIITILIVNINLISESWSSSIGAIVDSFTSGNTGSSVCKISCDHNRFDIGKDCAETNGTKCQCVAHCCWAFDCRMWPVFAQCRKKCRVLEWNRFGSMKGPVKCDHFRCPSTYLIEWDLRDVSDKKRINCIQHCCYAFNCKKYSGYCREMCAQ